MNATKPVLAGLRTDQQSNLQFVRDLSQEELSKSEKFSSEFAIARSKFHLFRIVQLNFEAWEEFLKPESVAAHNARRTDCMVEADRLLLNYLTSAKSLLDHFRQFYIQNFRKTAKKNDFDDLLTTLASKKWAFAFCQDFRNFAQHCGLPTGGVHLKEVDGRITKVITADAEWLLQNFTNWKISQLDKTHGTIDLIACLREYHECLFTHVGKFLASAFVPQIREIALFYDSLKREVEAAAPGHRMVIAIVTPADQDDINIHFEYIPNNVLAELGISIRKPS